MSFVANREKSSRSLGSFQAPRVEKNRQVCLKGVCYA